MRDIKCDMDKKYVDTYIGRINIAIYNGCTYKEMPGVADSDKLTVKSALTKVILDMKNGNKESIEPILIESCMNPGVKTIIPIVYEEYVDNDYKKSYNISTPYKKINSDEVLCAKTEDYIPMIRKNSCAECRNCGRC